MKTTRDAEQAISAITRIGGRPLFVGGCVRDWIIGVESKDIDIEVHGSVSVDEVEAALSAVGRVDAVGKSFGVLKFGHEVDVSFPRRDSKTGAGHTGFVVEFDQDMTVEEALARRDFTFNSIAMDAVTGEVIDPFGGRADIMSRTIRHTSDAFADDPLRVMRAVQFAGRFGFSIAPETAELCRTLHDGFDQLAVERIWMEWEKIFSKGKSMTAVWEALVETGWDVHFPEWSGEMTATTDRVIGKATQHPVSFQRRAAIIVGSMFVGKLTTLARFMARIDAPQWLRHAATKLAQDEHTMERLDVHAKVRVVARSLGGKVHLGDWLMVHWHQFGSPMWQSAQDQGILAAAKPRLLTGDMLTARGWEPGPVFGTVLQQAEVTQDRQGWTTDAEAVTWLETTWSGHK